ncbi:MAG: hypothetical protein IJ367_04235, partial [Clostridia bacterium]|nr:hypothetical protein [Clostridia bacterium]
HNMMFQNVSVPTLLKKAILILLSGILGMALYGIILKVLLGIFSVELLDYQGMNDTASLANLDIVASLYVVKETFLQWFFDCSGGISVFVILNLFVMLVTVVYYLKSIVINKVYKNPLNLVILVILGVMLLVGAGALAFVNPGVDYHNLMLMGYSVFYLFFILLYERGTEANNNHTAIKCWTVLITAMVLIANQVVIANVSYHKAQMAYEKSYGVLVRIADRIEQTPGAEACDKILVIGALKDSETYSVNLPPDMTGITDGYVLRADDETVGQSVLCSALNDYCGKDYSFVSGEEKKQMMQKETIQSMGRWPQEGCVAIIDDILVIKLGVEGEN